MAPPVIFRLTELILSGYGCFRIQKGGDLEQQWGNIGRSAWELMVGDDGGGGGGILGRNSRHREETEKIFIVLHREGRREKTQK